MLTYRLTKFETLYCILLLHKLKRNDINFVIIVYFEAVKISAKQSIEIQWVNNFVLRKNFCKHIINVLLFVKEGPKD